MQETSGKTKLKHGMTEEDKEYCAGCFFLHTGGKQIFCDYYAITKRRRPCPFGTGCTERNLSDKRDKKRKAFR